MVAARSEIDRTFEGAYGAFVPFASSVVERDGELVAATLVTRWEDRPFVAYAVTHPDHQRQGLARAGMLHAMDTLRRAGEVELRLCVTLANAPARTLYERLGFAIEE